MTVAFDISLIIKKAKSVTPSHRGELEISSLNQLFIDENKLSVTLFRRGFSWFDTGTHDSILQASNFVSSVEKNTGLKVACLEEIALNKRWITSEKLYQQIANLKGNYYDYLKGILD